MGLLVNTVWALLVYSLMKMTFSLMKIPTPPAASVPQYACQFTLARRTGTLSVMPVNYLYFYYLIIRQNWKNDKKG